MNLSKRLYSAARRAAIIGLVLMMALPGVMIYRPTVSAAYCLMLGWLMLIAVCLLAIGAFCED